MSIEKGVLYVVATPIGNRKDITPRAVEVLKSVTTIAAEDTRHSRPMLQALGVTTPLLALHEHNERKLTDKLTGRLLAGESLALISDAGTPLISDPGFPLVRACHRLGIRVSPIPGASALICALSAAGLPSDRFLFAGFPARTAPQRRKQLQDLAQQPATLIFYESSHRIQESLEEMSRVFGESREAVLARELTKMHETLLSGSLGDLCQRVEQDGDQRRGEFVVLVCGWRSDGNSPSPDSERVLRLLLEELPLRQAASLAARITGEKKNSLYDLALSWREE